MTTAQSEAEWRTDEIDLEEHGPEESEEDDTGEGRPEAPCVMDDVDDEVDDVIVIDD